MSHDIRDIFADCYYILLPLARVCRYNEEAREAPQPIESLAYEAAWCAIYLEETGIA